MSVRLWFDEEAVDVSIGDLLCAALSIIGCLTVAASCI